MMASFPLASNDGFFIAQEKNNFCASKTGVFWANGALSCSVTRNCSLSVSDHISIRCHRLHHRLCCTNKINLVHEKINVDDRLVKEDNNERRQKLSFRLRPRIRLLSRRWRRDSTKSLLDGFSTFLRKNVKRVTLSTCVSIVLGFCFLFLKITAVPTPKSVPYSDMITSLQNGNVAKVLFVEGSHCIHYNTRSWNEKGTQSASEESLPLFDNNASPEIVQNYIAGKNVLKKLTKPRTPVWEFSTRKIDHDESYLLSLIRERGTSYSSAPLSLIMSMRTTLITVLTLWIPLTPLMWLLYRQLSAANSPAKKRKPSNQLIGFEDVEGVDAAKVELMEIVCCLQGSINYSKLGAKLPKGVLLVGPPGTGKTLLARAVAGEAGFPFFSVSASEFVELFVGRGAARIRDLFSVARKNAPSIIFIDELDAVGGKRGRSFNDERDQTLNQLLTEMDGFESDTNVIVIAATNRPEALDPALCRPGRFSRKVYVGEPDEEGRKKILRLHFRGVPLEEDTALICDLVASLTQGFVGADLANIVNESALLAARRGAEMVSREDVMEAIERAKLGINESQTRVSAISKELGKLFPWMPSLMRRNADGRDGTQGPLGYQTLS